MPRLADEALIAFPEGRARAVAVHGTVIGPDTRRAAAGGPGWAGARGGLDQRLPSPAGCTSAVLAGQPRQVHLQNRPPRLSTLASESGHEPPLALQKDCEIFASYSPDRDSLIHNAT
jgi:hypothetical protein